MRSLLAYIGPETIVPLTSILAVIGGVLLFAWHWVCGMCLGCWRAVFPRKEARPATDAADQHVSQL